jgi:osmotically-inducible protein OsmY
MKPRVAPVAALSAALALSLLGCSRHDDRTIGQRVDAANERAQTAAENAKDEAKRAATDIREETRVATSEATDKVTDAAISASIKTDLAKDPDLSALKIDVDTSNGHVTLHGSAPSDEARARATKLASNVKGVTSVDNELSVQQ